MDPLGEAFEFFIPLGIQIEKDFNYVNTRIKFHSFRALKRYLKEKSLTHDLKKHQFENLLHRIFKRTINRSSESFFKKFNWPSDTKQNNFFDFFPKIVPDTQTVKMHLKLKIEVQIGDS